MRKKKSFLQIVALLFLLFSVSSLFSEISKGDFAVGLNFPGLGARYFLSGRTALEFKGQYETDIIVGGLRGYYYFSPVSKYLLFAGLEGDFISFEGDESKGSGIAGEYKDGLQLKIVRSEDVKIEGGSGKASQLEIVQEQDDSTKTMKKEDNTNNSESDIQIIQE